MGAKTIQPVTKTMERESDLYPMIEAALSDERLGTYLAWADGDRNRAVRLYTLNAVLSESFHTPLHMLEVALRNRVNDTMAERHGPNWFDDQNFARNGQQAEMLVKAKRDLKEAGKEETPGRIVAALTLAYWTSMLGKEYENLWQTTLHRIARQENGKGLRRKDLSAILTPVRVLRNRIAHHEPILHWDLPKHHQAILRLTGWLSPVAESWCRDHSRFVAVFPAGGVILSRERPVAE